MLKEELDKACRFIHQEESFQNALKGEEFIFYEGLLHLRDRYLPVGEFASG